MSDNPTPNFSRATPETRVRCAVALTQGWAWRPYRWWDGRVVPLLWIGPDDPRGDDFDRVNEENGDPADGTFPHDLPDPENDRYDWATLLEKELVGLSGSLDQWYGVYSVGPGLRYGPKKLTIGAAVVAAVLAKYGVTP